MRMVLKYGVFWLSFYSWNKIDLFVDAWRSAGFDAMCDYHRPLTERLLGAGSQAECMVSRPSLLYTGKSS